MSDDRGDDRNPETGAFDADEWFRTQFGAPPAEPAPAQPAPAQPSPAAPSPAQPSPAVPDLPPPTAPTSAPPATPAVADLPPPTAPTSAPPATPALPDLPPPTRDPFEPPPTQLTPLIEPVPTQPTDAVELEATQPSEIIVPAVAGAGDAPTEVVPRSGEPEALDELFGTERFQEYDEQLIPAATRATRRGAGPTTGVDGAAGEPDAPARAPLSRTQKVLLWVAGSLVALLALIAIFFLGTRIPALVGSAPAPQPTMTATPTPTPTPTATVRPVGPVAPGEYVWDELWGGECLEPYVDAWSDEYTVVDCAEAHTAQLVARAPFPLPEGVLEYGEYPGEAALAAQIPLLCGRPGVIDLASVAGLTDIQVQGAFAVTEEQWEAGMNDYFCFASRSTGEFLVGSIVPAV